MKGAQWDMPDTMLANDVNVAEKEKGTHIPGEIGVWIFILGDMLIFSLLFCVFVYYRGNDVELYRTSQLTLNKHYGAINTLFLLTSSLFVVLGIRSAKNKNSDNFSKFFLLAILFGGAFAVVKFIEYGEKIGHGITLLSNEFYMYYFILTGIHFLHVFLGLAFLTYLRSRYTREINKNNDIMLLECGASYWHMVDLLWIVLFSLLYLMK